MLNTLITIWSATAYILGCAKPPAATPDVRVALYDVAVATASGPRRITSVYRLAAEPISDQSWRVRTVHSEGTWEDGANTMAFNSDTPSDADAWPLTLQHTISTVPATIEFSAYGAPLAVKDLTGMAP